MYFCRAVCAMCNAVWGADMNEVITLRGLEPRKILQTAVAEGVPAIMSYLSRGKWHVAKVLPTDIGANTFNIAVGGTFCNTSQSVKAVSPREKGSILQKNCETGTRKRHPINVRVDQPVGISLKYGYGKFIFEATVVDFEPPSDSTGCGTIILAVPDRVELVQRRSYFRVEVPESLKVDVTVWHRSHRASCATHNCWQGRLVDISAGGAQIEIDPAQKPDFKKGQFVCLRFTPMPYEAPLMFDAQIRTVLTTADGKSICFGLQVVGLEVGWRGREVLSRLVGIVERYYQLNRSGVTRHSVALRS